jgi:hypothetical protein
MHAHLTTHMCTLKRAHTRSQTQTKAYTHTKAHKGIHTNTAHTHIHTCTQTHACTRTYVHTLARKHAHMQVMKSAMAQSKQRVPLILICGGLLPRVPYNPKKVTGLVDMFI